MSGRRHEISYFEAFNANITADAETPVTNVKNVDKVSYQINWSLADSIICDIEVYASNDYLNKDKTVNPNPIWTKLNPNTGIRIDNTDDTGCHLININDFAFDFIRLGFVYVSGSGNVKVILSGHSLGA